jgi:hypothetical protein
MKNQFLRILCFGVWAIAATFPAFGQDDVAADSTGLPGDHFSLQGALELFKKASSPEEFEKLLNASDANVNNLDLDEDGDVDYIRVVDNMDGDVHAIVLQVAVSETESQDIAVIGIEKQGDEKAILQIVGDEDIFGEQVIYEPYDDDVQSEGKGGPSADYSPVRVVVNVWYWPSVRFVYAPGYRAWASPWRWRTYPGWWRPWRPLAWHRWHVAAAPYRVHRYHAVKTHRVVRAHKVYAPRRSHSKVVHSRTTTVVKGRHGGTIKKTTTKTKVTGPRGNSAVRKKTTVKGKRR